MCFLEAYSTSCPQNAPPHDYPDISEPVIGRAKIVQILYVHYLILAVSPNSFCV